MIRNRVNRLAACSVALGVALAATLPASGASPPAMPKRTDVKIETKGRSPAAAGAAARVGVGSLPLTHGSLAPAHGVEIRPYVAIPNTNDTRTLQVWSRKTGR
jgi:hypothetical protein